MVSINHGFGMYELDLGNLYMQIKFDIASMLTLASLICLKWFFSFAWLELVSHRSFMPKMLIVNGQKGWPYIQRLLVDLFQFMEPFLRNAELGVPVCLFITGFHCSQLL